MLAPFPVSGQPYKRQLLHNRAHREAPPTPTAELPPPPVVWASRRLRRRGARAVVSPPSLQQAPGLGVTEGLSEQVLQMCGSDGAWPGTGVSRYRDKKQPRRLNPGSLSNDPGS